MKFSIYALLALMVLSCKTSSNQNDIFVGRPHAGPSADKVCHAYKNEFYEDYDERCRIFNKKSARFGLFTPKKPGSNQGSKVSRAKKMRAGPYQCKDKYTGYCSEEEVGGIKYNVRECNPALNKIGCEKRKGTWIKF